MTYFAFTELKIYFQTWAEAKIRIIQSNDQTIKGKSLIDELIKRSVN